MMPIPLIMGLGPEEIILIIVVIVLLFGATKLPELARGSGRALRIFKAETQGLREGDDSDQSTAESRSEDGGSSSKPQARPQDASSDEDERGAHPTD